MIQPIILAAGRGTRMRSSRPKVLHDVGGRPMLGRVLAAVGGVGSCQPPLVVVGHGASEIRARFGVTCRYVLQAEISGTASAVKACLPCLAPETRALLILYGDSPLVRSESLRTIVRIFREQGPALALFTTTVPDYEDWRASFLHFGRVIRLSDGVIEKIVEYKDATKSERAVLEVNPGIYCVDLNWLKSCLPRIQSSPATGEYYLTDIANFSCLDGVTVASVPLPPEEAIGLNTQDDIDRAESLLARGS